MSIAEGEREERRRLNSGGGCALGPLWRMVHICKENTFAPVHKEG